MRKAKNKYSYLYYDETSYKYVKMVMKRILETKETLKKLY